MGSFLYLNIALEFARFRVTLSLQLDCGATVVCFVRMGAHEILFECVHIVPFPLPSQQIIRGTNETTLIDASHATTTGYRRDFAIKGCFEHLCTTVHSLTEHHRSVHTGRDTPMYRVEQRAGSLTLICPPEVNYLRAPPEALTDCRGQRDNFT